MMIRIGREYVMKKPICLLTVLLMTYMYCPHRTETVTAEYTSGFRSGNIEFIQAFGTAGVDWRLVFTYDGISHTV